MAVAHAVSPLILLGTHWWFGVDETVYLSQINRHVPAGVFSAPRARGTTFVAAPITLLTSSLAAVRIWLATVSGLSLFLAFRGWLRLRPGYAVPLAALMFSTIWSVVYYGFEAMPNEWVAFAILMATSSLILFVIDGRRRDWILVVVALAWIALLRPSDAAYAGVALVACAAFGAFHGSSLRRRALAVLAVALGVALGAAEWVIEAYARFGGLSARIHGAQAENGGAGLHFAGAAQARSLAGPLLCRTGCHVHASLIYQLWWIALAALVVVAVKAVIGRRVSIGPDRRVVVVSVVVALVMAAQYVFAVTYAAPRFLIPTYALLAIPCAIGAQRVLSLAGSGRVRVVVTAVLTLFLVGNTGLQVRALRTGVEPFSRRFASTILADARFLRAHGVTGPCLVAGSAGYDQNMSYAMGCYDSPSALRAVPAELASGQRVVWLSNPARAHGTGVHWRRYPLPGTLPGAPRFAYLASVPGRTP